MKAELVKERPISGEYEELVFDASGDSTCVKFEDSEYIEYLGIFGIGIGNNTIVAQNNDRAFIISKGQGYVFDINERKVIHKSEEDNLLEVVSPNYNQYFVAYDSFSLFVFKDNLVFENKRITSDGIKIISMENAIIKGQVCDFIDWVDFSLDLSTMDYNCEWECDID